MKYTLRQLEVFLATAHHDNITRAAQALNMSQSAASSALKELESQLNVQLFDRVGKRLQISSAGHYLIPQARALIDQAQQIERNMLQQQTLGDLKVGATLTIGNYLAVPIMRRYRESNPRAHVHLEVSNTAQIVQKIANFELDIGLIEGELRHPQLTLETWQEDELCVFAAPNHPLATLQRPLHDDDLLQAHWIVREPGSGTRQTFDRAMSGLITELNMVLELQHTEAIKRAVESQMGVGCLSRVTLREAFARKSLVELAVPHRNFKRHFYIALHQQKYLDSSILHWRDLCLAADSSAN